MASIPSKSLRWCFTVNNPGIWRPIYDAGAMVYLIWEHEVAPQTNTPHIQGYIRLKKRTSLAGVKKLLSDRGHYQHAKGTEKQNKIYCSKNRSEAMIDWAEHGEYDEGAGQGKRSDLLAATELIQSGARMQQVAEAHPVTFVRNAAGLERLRLVLTGTSREARNVRNVVLWGATATGKTHRVRIAYPDVYLVRPGRGPFDTYDGELTILFDEFNPVDWSITEMNLYLDKWPCSLNCRYFNKTARWTRVFICSNIDPADWWPNESYRIRDAFFRRVNLIENVRDVDQIVNLNPSPSPPTTPSRVPTRPSTPKLGSSPTQPISRSSSVDKPFQDDDCYAIDVPRTPGTN